MEGADPVLDVLAEPSTVAGAVEISRGPRMIGNKELAEYAKATGVKLVKLKMLKKKALLGELIEKLGAAQYGTAILFESPDMIDDAIKQCNSMIDEYRGEPEVAAQLLKAKVALIDLQVKAGQALIKSKRDAGEVVMPSAAQQIPFPPHQPVPVQVNLQLNQLASEKDKQ